jgi:hypothetical protein
MMALPQQLLRRVIILAALCAGFIALAANPAQARVFVGIGIPFYGPAYYPPPFYYPPPPAYYPPPVVYAPPQSYVPPPSASSSSAQACHAEAYVCPMDRPVASGGNCYCLGNGGQRVWGRAY